MIEFPDATLEDQMKIAGQRLGSEESFLDNSGIGSVLKTIGKGLGFRCYFYQLWTHCY